MTKSLFRRSTLTSLALLIALYWLIFHYLVPRNRRPGQMTVVEAQAMDMTAMKPPEGVLPVALETVEPRPFEEAVTYTGTVAPLNEEVISARVTGRLTWMPYYAGDRIQAGQVVARLDAGGGEYAAREAEAVYGILAAQQERGMAEAEARQAQAQRRQAASMGRAAQAMEEEAGAMVREKYAMVEEAQRMVEESGAEVVEAERETDFAQAQVREAEKDLIALQREVEQARQEQKAKQQAMRKAESELAAVRQELAETEAELERARQEVARAQQEAAGMKADLTYWEAEIGRARQLYEAKAISKDELQQEEAQQVAAQAKYQAAQASVQQAQAMVRAAYARQRRTEAMIAAARSELAMREAEVGQVEAMVAQREARVDAARERIAQMRAMAGAAQAKVERTKAAAAKTQARLQQAQAAVQGAQARITQAQAEAERAQGMREEAGAMEQRADRQALQAEAMTSQARSAASAVGIVRGYTEIRSLTTGYVTERVVAPGQLVQPGSPILRIAQLDRVRVQAFVAEKDLSDLRPGAILTLQSPRDGRGWNARVSTVFPAADATTRTGLVEAVVDNPDRALLPGQSVVVRLVKRSFSDALTVPNRALTRSGEQPAVWLALAQGASGPTDYTCPMHPAVHSDQPGRCPECGMDLVPSTRQTGETRIARLRVVQLGPTDGMRTVVLGGLSPGDQVVVQGWQSLRDGMPVTAVEWGEQGPAELPALPASPSVGEGMENMPGMSQEGGHQHGGR